MRGIRLVIAVSLVLLIAQWASANAFVRGAYYRLGDDDPGAVAGVLGNDPTKDSFADMLDLSRFGTPQYTADVPANGPAPNKLAMSFANNSLGQPFAYYGRSKPLGMLDQGYALEAWAKAGPPPDPGTEEIIAYNGDPLANGFGFFRDGDTGKYIFKSITFSQALGPSTDNAWHHLAYVRTFSTADYYFDGQLVKETSNDPVPLAATGGFWVGGMTSGGGPASLFNGSVDEIRYQSFNPLAAGAFDPTSFLITVPEPGGVAVLLFASWLLAFQPRRRAPML